MIGILLNLKFLFFLRSFFFELGIISWRELPGGEIVWLIDAPSCETPQKLKDKLPKDIALEIRLHDKSYLQSALAAIEHFPTLFRLTEDRVSMKIQGVAMQNLYGFGQANVE